MSETHSISTEETHANGSHANAYVILGVMAALHFVAMFVLMYAMVDVFANVYSNLNQAYMAGLMTAPMVVLEVLLMRSMYRKPAINAVVIAVSVIAVVALFFFIRQQTAISDAQFLRSMIPHHGGAVLMCEQAPIQNPAIVELCASIIASQQAEIAQMKAILAKVEQ